MGAIYFCVSGGPFGLEELMQSGTGMAILLIVITPFLWAMPAALMTAELAAAIPKEGGYYHWVKRAMGPFAGFQCAWWTWLYSWVDVAIYPVLFTKAVDGLLKLSGRPAILDGNPWLKWVAGLFVIVPFTWLNIRGAKLVGTSSILFGVALLLPFALMSAFGVPGALAHPAAVVLPIQPAETTFWSAFGGGLFVVMWNYLGWDSLSTIAEEVEEPSKVFPKALLIGIPIVTLSYLLPAAVGLVEMPDLSQWTEGVWPEVGRRIAGPWLGWLIALAGVISAAGLFSATLLGASRIPFALAEDHMLPKFLTRLHPKYGTPWVAILVSSVFYTIFSYSEFADLAVVDVILYSAAILLEFAALAILRAKEPNMPRPFKIGGGWPSLLFICLAPLAMVGFGVYSQFQEEGRTALWLSLGALATGPAVYAFMCRIQLNDLVGHSEFES